MRDRWMKANYLIAIALATLGWIWFSVWILKELFF
jgi:hypothetical protein